MSTASEFEIRRRERRRREKLRKKRIRAFILFVVLVAIIVIICIAVSSFSKRDDNAQLPANNTTIETTAAPTAEPVQTASNIPPASEENNLLQIIADSGQKKRCYLTFDDGPTENITPQILDTLRRYNVKATFFEVGSLIDASPDMARRVYEEGHLIANHSHGHNYEKLYASTDNFITEIRNCENSIKNVTNGEEPFKLMRFPGGSYNAGDHASMKQQCKTTLKENDYYYVDWNALNGDAEGKKKNAAELLEYLKQTAAGYNNLIVLMHDASTKQATADSLGPIIEYLTEQGYTFHRLDDIDYQASSATSEPSSEDSASTSSVTSSATKAPASSPEAGKASNSPAPSSDVKKSDDSKDSDKSDKDSKDSANTKTASTPAASTGAIIIQ